MTTRLRSAAVAMLLLAGCKADAPQAQPQYSAAGTTRSEVPHQRTVVKQPKAAGSTISAAVQPRTQAPRNPANANAAASVKTAARAAASPTKVSTKAYPWHGDPSIQTLPATASLRARFAAPEGFRRVKLSPNSFGAWLRELPLAAKGTPVRAYDGDQLMAADHRNIAAVTTLDIGKRDLQQCADAVMRLHAEWLWQSERAAEASYVSGAGPIPWQRFRAGGFTKPKGNSFVWGKRSARKNNHATYRKYLDVVFAWSNTVALARQGARPARDSVRPGDFFVLPGSPGHSVLILDVSENADGERMALIGQSFMPAQSFQVLRPSPASAWFALTDDEGVKTPFWRRFPWDSLRRLDSDKSAPKGA